jgi:hypothetical protein
MYERHLTLPLPEAASNEFASAALSLRMHPFQSSALPLKVPMPVVKRSCNL